MPVEILSLKPYLKSEIWGGQKLKEIYDGSGMTDIAEAWVLSAHPKGPSIIDSGKWRGNGLPFALGVMGPENTGYYGSFPVLIKFIDACRDLSIQVHPDDAFAREYENDNGKTECWYILSADPGAEIIYGLCDELTADEFIAAARSGEIEQHVNRVKVKAGDIIPIPSGTIHAICAGITLCEIQQSSDVTYRIYDYKRPGKDGKPRDLHVDKAALVADLSPADTPDFSVGAPVTEGDMTASKLVHNEFFVTDLVELDGERVCSIPDRNAQAGALKRSFVSYVILEGEGAVSCDSPECRCDRLRFTKGGSVYIPAGCGEYALEGKFKAVRTALT